MHEVLVNRLGGLSLHRKSVVRLTDRPEMTLDVYRGRKTTKQHKQQRLSFTVFRLKQLRALEVKIFFILSVTEFISLCWIYSLFSSEINWVSIGFMSRGVILDTKSSNLLASHKTCSFFKNVSMVRITNNYSKI